MPTQYLVLQDNALEAQMKHAREKMGFEVDGVKPWDTEDPFEIIHHPTTAFSAIVIQDIVPMGMRDGEDWARGKPRTYEGKPVTGKPSQDETTWELWPTNRPLKDKQWMIDNGWPV